MDSEPKTRRESKKTAKDKKSGIYSSKHVRQQQQIVANTTNNKAKQK